MIPRASVQALVDAIAAKFDVEKVILFGSYAYGQPTEDSDVDLLVVMEYEGRSLAQCVKLLVAAKRDFPCDLLVMRPEELKRRCKELNPITVEAIDRGGGAL